MYWEIVPTPQGCQLFVDGQPIGSPAEPPPSGWLQRVYGILMPIEYKEIRALCMCSPVAGARRAASPSRTRKCHSKVTTKGLWVCCQGTCKLAVRMPM